MRILVTGAGGRLGRLLVPVLAAAGHEVRAGGRRGAWAHDLATGVGLGAAVDGVDTVIHLASSAFGSPRDVDVLGTGRLMEAARAAGVRHVLYPSIVGIHLVPTAYYAAKLEAEGVVAAGGVPHTTVRITQFHCFVLELAEMLLRWPIVVAPAGVRFQPVHEGAVAAELLAMVEAGPAGRVADLGGPEVVELVDVVRRAKGDRTRCVVSRGVPSVGPLRALRQGALCLDGGRLVGPPFTGG